MSTFLENVLAEIVSITVGCVQRGILALIGVKFKKKPGKDNLRNLQKAETGRDEVASSVLK